MFHQASTSTPAPLFLSVGHYFYFLFGCLGLRCGFGIGGADTATGRQFTQPHLPPIALRIDICFCLLFLLPYFLLPNSPSFHARETSKHHRGWQSLTTIRTSPFFLKPRTPICHENLIHGPAIAANSAFVYKDGTIDALASSPKPLASRCLISGHCSAARLASRIPDVCGCPTFTMLSHFSLSWNEVRPTSRNRLAAGDRSVDDGMSNRRLRYPS